MPDNTREAQQVERRTGGPRRFFCNDVLLDALHFLRRNEHAQVRLASQRLQWLSNTVCARYPTRLVHWLEVRGVYAHPDADPSGLQIVANSMRVHPPSGDSYLADFPAVEPPEDIVHLSKLRINDFVGPELFQFLRVSIRLLGRCCLYFTDFDNFVRHHSADFLSRFFRLFPSGANCDIELWRVSPLAAPLFIDHPTLFDTISLVVECTETFPLGALQGWLHLDEGQPPKQQKGRYLNLNILVDYQAQAGHSVASVDHFTQQLRQHFMSATSCCSFYVYIIIAIIGGPHIPELDPFVEDNERTGELLEFSRDRFRYCYRIERKRRESATTGQEEAETEERKKTTRVYIRKVVQGDKQLVDSAEAEAGK